jgi:glyoxylase-like metal-dependent hydrolase (beta-lactamase superfamily II)
MTIRDKDNNLHILTKNMKSAKQRQNSSLQNYLPVTLFSILLAIVIVQLFNSQSASANKILMNESLSLDNDSSSLPSSNNLSEKVTDKMNSLPKIHAHMSGEKGIFANGYLIETANGVVVIDSALTVSESKALKAQLDSINKTLLAVLLTHPHPDHVAGVTYLVTSKTSSSSPSTLPYIPIISLESVEGIMNATEQAKRIHWTPIFKEEWINKWTYPNQNVKDEEAVTFDGLTYRVHDLGPGGDSDANSIWILENKPNVAFVGDLIFNGHHPYIADDHIINWLKNLDRARDLLSNITTIYPGHGQPGSIDLIDSQESYLLNYVDEVRRLSGGNSTLTENAKEELTQRMVEYLPDAGLSFLIAQSADSVTAELVGVAESLG